MEKRLLKEVILQKGMVFGFTQQILDPNITESIAQAGFDFIILDLEHSGRTIDSVHSCLIMAAAYNIPLIIRTADKYQFMIEQALDAGAQGVLVPTIETVEDCENLVKSAKYAPLGERGYCPLNATNRWMNDSVADPIKFAEQANQNTFVIALIETPLGFTNLKDMVKVKGIDRIHVWTCGFRHETR